jgi:predicted O-methyltransferase YrrM
MSNAGHSLENLKIMIKCMFEPRSAFRFARRGFVATDPVYVSQSDWYYGKLERVPVAKLFPNSVNFELKLVRALDRTWMTSITAEELCALLAIAKDIDAKKILEIGTFDGNTSLNLAVNTNAMVTTMDLAPEFDAKAQKNSLAYPEVDINVTNRTVLGRQFNAHPLKDRIRQVFGDSAKLDWGKLGGPFDLILIDGCHDYLYVKSDTNNALAHLAPGGVIVWHDYGMVPDVCRVVDALENTINDLKLYALEGTRFAVAVKGKES